MLKSLWTHIFRRRRNGPRLTYVIPFFASHDRLEACLDSLSRHTGVSHEILLVDDGNAGFDFTHVAKRQNLRVLKKRQNSGPGACRNLGMAKANGDYIQFVDSDDEIMRDPAAYFQSVDSLKLNEQPDIITGLLDGSKPAGRMPKATSVADDVSLIRLNCFTAHLYRTDFLKEIGARFPEDTRTAEDTAFLAQVLPRARTIVTTEVATYRYHTREGSLSNAPLGWSDFRQRYGIAGTAIADHLRPYPDAQRIKCSVIFKYGVATLKRHASAFTQEERLKACAILQDLLDRTDLTSAAAHTVRRKMPVYWDTHYDRCAELLVQASFKDFLDYIDTNAIRIFKGEKQKPV